MCMMLLAHAYFMLATVCDTVYVTVVDYLVVKHLSTSKTRHMCANQTHSLAHVTTQAAQMLAAA